MNIKEILDKKNIFAVVGASNDENKYGYKVYKMLKEKGYKVFPVNPGKTEIQGDRAYANLAELPENPDVISVITPPPVSEKITDEAITLGIKTIWFQPGAESRIAIQKAEKSGLNTIHDQCILIEGAAY